MIKWLLCRMGIHKWDSSDSTVNGNHIGTYRYCLRCDLPVFTKEQRHRIRDEWMKSYKGTSEDQIEIL